MARLRAIRQLFGIPVLPYPLTTNATAEKTDCILITFGDMSSSMADGSPSVLQPRMGRYDEGMLVHSTCWYIPHVVRIRPSRRQSDRNTSTWTNHFPNYEAFSAAHNLSSLATV